MLSNSRKANNSFIHFKKASAKKINPKHKKVQKNLENLVNSNFKMKINFFQNIAAFW